MSFLLKHAYEFVLIFMVLCSSDLQLAIALQQQEFEDQSPRSNPTPQPPTTSVGASRLITGPQVFDFFYL